MKLDFSVETEDMFNCEEGISFEDLFTDALKKEIVSSANKNLGSDQFKKFAELTADTIVSEIKLKMQNFLDEDIALTDQWGKETFIGSIEDLLKTRFDDILLRPVDSKGKTVEGCTSSGMTWIEWFLEQKIEDVKSNVIESAKRNINTRIDRIVKEELANFTNDTIKEKVGIVFSNILIESKDK